MMYPELLGETRGGRDQAQVQARQRLSYGAITQIPLCSGFSKGKLVTWRELLGASLGTGFPGSLSPRSSQVTVCMSFPLMWYNLPHTW